MELLPRPKSLDVRVVVVPLPMTVSAWFNRWAAVRGSATLPNSSARAERSLGEKTSSVQELGAVKEGEVAGAAGFVDRVVAIVNRRVRCERSAGGELPRVRLGGGGGHNASVPYRARALNSGTDDNSDSCPPVTVTVSSFDLNRAFHVKKIVSTRMGAERDATAED